MCTNKRIVKLKKTEIVSIGPGAFQHSVQCWICQEEPAVYDAYPNWHFIPCWNCQKKYSGIWTKKKRFIDKIKELYNRAIYIIKEDKAIGKFLDKHGVLKYHEARRYHENQSELTFLDVLNKFDNEEKS